MMRTIVTGGDSGIGRAAAITLAREGHDVAITYRRDADGAAEASAEAERVAARPLRVHQLDLTEAERIPEVLDEMIEALGGLDALVNNAGAMHQAPVLDHRLEDWQRVIDVDLTGCFLVAQHAARHMAESGGGHVLNVTSVHEHIPLPQAAAYCAAKAGMGLVSKVMALELAGAGVRVNTIGPGEVATPMTGQHEADPRAQRRPAIPLGRPAHAEEIGEAIAAVLGAGGSYMTGSSIVVDGGLSLIPAAENVPG